MRARDALLASTALGLGAVAWGAVVEVRAFALRQFTVPVLAPGSRPLRVLHLSDAHMLPSHRRKQAWLRSLAELEPDLVVNTGDNLSHADALPAVLHAYEPLLDVPGVFVFGSNDYFSPVPKNPLRYLRGGSGVAAGGDWARERDLPFEQMRQAFTERGWVDLTNRHDTSRSTIVDSRSSVSTTRTWSTTSSTRFPPTARPTSRSVSPTPRTCACSTGGTAWGTP